MISRAASVVSLPASSAEGTLSTEPAFRRFMFSPAKACGLARNSDTSIWSSETPGRWMRPAMRDRESPGRTRMSSPPAAAAGAAVAGAATRGAGSVTGRAARGEGAGTGVAAAGGAGKAASTLGAGEITGAAAGGAAGVARAVGGSNSIVYSRTSRPLDQVASTITSTKGSSTARSLVTRSTERPLRLTSCTEVEGSTAL